jgi:NAD(P)-dependent dehydrogenase (short-subunit alcohol dehydrogenase family)
MTLKDKIILVIGGAAGIGAATVRLCAERGATMIIADVNAADGEAIAAEIGGSFIKVDITNRDSVQAMYDQIDKRYGRLDVLLHTAAIMKGAYIPVDEFSLDMFNTVINVNITGSWLCSQLAVPLMRKAGRGVIVLTSSIAATSGSSSFAYGTSKGAVNSLGITLANKLGPENIRVNVLAPGDIDTGMKRTVLEAQAERGVNQPVGSTPTQPAASDLGKPEGVAKVLAWLASDDADYVRGSVATR